MLKRLKLDLTKYQEEHYFRLDSVFDEKRTNLDIYNNAVKPIVEFALAGGKVSCFAYGQTGSGKTYTMIGDAKNPGLYLLSAEDIFEYLSESSEGKTIAVSYFEIYCGKVFDLLNNREKLVVREDAKQNVNVVGLTRHQVLDADGLFQKITNGNSVRVTSQTGKNNDSSRSHAILQIYVIFKGKISGTMSFIDLAGNERGEDTKDHEAQTRHDGAEISKSLLALKECIRALDQDKKHVPFRGSKLTMVLKDSFVGNCKTVMIGNISPALANSEYTLNTLRYADRVKELKKDAKDRQKAGNSELMLARGENIKQTEIKVEKNLGIIAAKFDANEDVFKGKGKARNFQKNKEGSVGDGKGRKGYAKEASEEDDFEEEDLGADDYGEEQSGALSARGMPESSKKNLLAPKNAASKTSLNSGSTGQSKNKGRAEEEEAPKGRSLRPVAQKGRRREEELEKLESERETIREHLVKEENSILRKHTAHVRLLTNLFDIVS